MALEGHGVPMLLGASIANWMQPSSPLYIVTEWIEGPTLAQSSGKSPTLDQAVNVTRALLHTLHHCHALGIHHRDLKPDNILLRSGKFDDPVIIDFGMSSTAAPSDEFRTPIGQELGNRFLRLPEHAPGNHDGDARVMSRSTIQP